MTAAELIARLDCVKQNGRGWTARCPSHDDKRPSLSIGTGRNGGILVKCFGGCDLGEILGALGLTKADLFPQRNGGRRGSDRGQPKRGKKNARKCAANDSAAPSRGLTLAELSRAKSIPESFLRSLGVRDQRYVANPAVRVPYVGLTGEITAVQFRISLDGDRFRWRSGDKAQLYGMNRMDAIRQHKWVLLVEGASDCWTGWLHDLPVLGVPGKDGWRSAWAQYLRGLEVFVWQEPGAESFARKIAATLPDLKVVISPEGVKDLNDAHCQGQDIVAVVERLRAEAVPFECLRREETAERLAELREQAAPVLAAPDPLVLVQEAVGTLGYGGDLRPPTITYLAATGRVLGQREGSMPVHLLLLGIPAVGKSYTVRVVRSLLPEVAYHTIDAGSARVLIYDEADLRNRVLIVGEADSLPAGEDNPAASAMRNLLQDHALHYSVVVKNPDTGQFEVQQIHKPGPTTLITTSVKRLKPQLDSRLFCLAVPDDHAQVEAALTAQAQAELHGIANPDPALTAFQAYLQALAPWEVVVPFADRLSRAIGRSSTAPRILRDYARLLSLVKSVAVLRHQHRQRDPVGRLIADLADYRTVFGLVNEMYAGSISGADQRIRAAVEAVSALLGEQGRVGGITVTQVARRLGISVPAASARLRTAIAQGWVVNEETTRGRPWRLHVGEALPEPVGLPHPDSLTEGSTTPPDNGADPD